MRFPHFRRPWRSSMAVDRLKERGFPFTLAAIARGTVAHDTGSPGIRDHDGDVFKTKRRYLPLLWPAL
jgi:hypothetical protein